MSGDRCNICKEVYQGLALDCACTNYGVVEDMKMRTDPMTVREMLIILHDQHPEAQVEFEVPDLGKGFIRPGDRIFVTEINPCWYNNPANRWVTLK